MRKLDQCAEIAGESARGWKQSRIEHCDEPRSHGRPARLHQVRAEEVGISKAYIDVNPIQPEKSVLKWLMLTGMPSARRCIEASKEKIGKKCVTPTR